MIGNPTYRGVVHTWQCDHMGHLNVMHYVGKFDEASWSFFSQIGMTMERMRADNSGLAAVQQNITYAREVMPGATLLVNSQPREIGGKILKFTHEMIISETGELCASCAFTVVHMDRKARKATPFPDDIVSRVQAAIPPA